MMRTLWFLPLILACGGASTTNTQSTAETQTATAETTFSSVTDQPTVPDQDVSTEVETTRETIEAAPKVDTTPDGTVRPPEVSEVPEVPEAPGKSIELFRECRGRMDRRRADKVLKKVHASLGECFLVELEATPNLKGDSKFTIKIDKSGKVDGIHNISPFNQTTKTCMETRIKALKFRKPRGGCATLSKSFHFEGHD